MLSKELLEILACPICKNGIVQEGDRIICVHCKKSYPIKNSIPIMLIEEARDLNTDTRKEGIDR